MDIRTLTAAAAFIGGCCAAPLLGLAEKLLAEQRGLEAASLSSSQRLYMAAGCGLMYAAAACRARSAGELVFALAVFSLFWIATWFDIRYRLIPNQVVAAMLIAGAAACLCGYTRSGILDSLLGAAVGGLLFAVPCLFGGKVGAGDVKLAAAVGLCAGTMGIFGVTVIMGVLILAFTLFSRRSVLSCFKECIPMGPFITLAYMLVFIK